MHITPAGEGWFHVSADRITWWTISQNIPEERTFATDILDELAATSWTTDPIAFELPLRMIFLLARALDRSISPERYATKVGGLHVLD